MKHIMVCTSHEEYEDSASHCQVCGFIRTGDDVLCNIPLKEDCPGKAADAAGATERGRANEALNYLKDGI